MNKIISSGRSLYSSKAYREKQRRGRIKLIALAGCFVLFIALFFYAAYHKNLLISEVVVKGEVAAKAETIDITKDLLRGRYLYLVPRANALIYPEEDIESILLRKIPRFKTVATSLTGFTTLTIAVEERLPLALYCPNTSSDACYFIDKEGFIFAEAPNYSGEVYFIYTTSPALNEPVGKGFLSSEEFLELREFLENLNELDVHPISLEIGRQEYVLKLPTGGVIVWKRDRKSVV